MIINKIQYNNEDEQWRLVEPLKPRPTWKNIWVFMCKIALCLGAEFPTWISQKLFEI